MSCVRFFTVSVIILCVIASLGQAAEPMAGPDYQGEIAPLLRKYCGGCHIGDEPEGAFSVETYRSLQQGTPEGPAFIAGQSADSHFLRLMNGTAEPAMPPDGSEAPTAAEIALVAAWIDAGARGPAGEEPDRTLLVTPKLPPAQGSKPVTALAWAPQGGAWAQAQFQTVELINSQTQQLIRKFGPHPGKVNQVAFSGDGRRLLVASGVAGLYGRVNVWNVESGEAIQELTAGRDIFYDVAADPEFTVIAAAGYDQKIYLWDAKSGKLSQTLPGHNGAINDLAFSPDGSVLASASADETVKLWSVETGQRLDTLSQPLEEQFSVSFSPDGRQILAVGADHRIRTWTWVSKRSQQINPLELARFAHEGVILRGEFTTDGLTLLTLAEDGVVKVWDAADFRERHAFPPQSAAPLALAVHPSEPSLLVGLADGRVVRLAIPAVGESASPSPMAEVVAAAPQAGTEMLTPEPIAEAEPNSQPSAAQPVPVPSEISGVIAELGDEDFYQFTARAGEQIMCEIHAARGKSPLDSHLEVLRPSGERVERVRLQALRDSYFTFRGKDSNTTNDFRVHNWQEMELNEYLYANGEVVKLWLYPRGPDSGFMVYPGRGTRHTYFDTSPLAHALHEPCYVVRPVPPGEEIVPNGLPVFPVYFENDDDSRRRWGSDSRLTFTAPEDGTYVVRVRDVRGFGDENFHYKLTLRPRQPSFQVHLEGTNPTVPAGGGVEFRVRVDRLDDYEGPIEVSVDGLPPGFMATTPLVVQPGQKYAWGTISAAADAAAPAAEAAKASRLTARATIAGEVVEKSAGSLGEIKLGPPAEIAAEIIPAAGEPPAEGPVVLEIRPGETIQARVRIDRRKFKGPVGFGRDDPGHNLPHGVYVDNMGLNGLLVQPEDREQVFFITAADWVEPCERLFHIQAEVKGNPTSPPVLIRVLPRAPRTAARTE